ncbi:hypothetical protein [Natrialbaceae archaeon AArc-T1-2]|nr:hypothetical protein [Natrialbaceae archaeon AArc-T1-2]WIV65870.1 hypothetical protein QQ977_09165 [Natrialbaceae archaeon AArc-T1-2]
MVEEELTEEGACQVAERAVDAALPGVGLAITGIRYANKASRSKKKNDS